MNQGLPGSGLDTSERDELRLEAQTMSLYVAVVLLATLTALSHEATGSHPRVLAVVWGTAIGLALAHVYAFSLAARRVRAAPQAKRAAALAAGQVLGAMAVAVVVSVPVLLLPEGSDVAAARLVLAGLVGLSGYLVARDAGRSWPVALVAGLIVLVVGMAVALLKNILASH